MSKTSKIFGSILIVFGIGLGVIGVVQLMSNGYWLPPVLFGVALVAGGFALLSGAKASEIISELISTHQGGCQGLENW